MARDNTITVTLSLHERDVIIEALLRRASQYSDVIADILRSGAQVGQSDPFYDSLINLKNMFVDAEFD